MRLCILYEFVLNNTIDIRTISVDSTFSSEVAPSLLLNSIERMSQ
jgi:hypothetical protein